MTHDQIQAQVEFAPTTHVAKTQHRCILDYIERFGFVTPMGIFHHDGITKLSTRIGEIERRTGHVFQRTKVASTTRYGRPCHYFKYSLPEGESINNYR